MAASTAGSPNPSIREVNRSALALENAASVASLLLTTEATIVEKPEEKKSADKPAPEGLGAGGPAPAPTPA